MPIACRSLTVCRGQSRNIHCHHPDFLFILYAVYGYSENASANRCSKDMFFDGCNKHTLDYFIFTTEQSITDIRVPNRNITCRSREWPLTYVEICYLCIPGAFIIHMCIYMHDVNTLNARIFLVPHIQYKRLVHKCSFNSRLWFETEL